MDGYGRFPSAAAIHVVAGLKVHEHWLRLTSRPEEPSQPAGPKPGKPNKTAGSYTFLLRAVFSDDTATEAPEGAGCNRQW